MKKYIAIRLVKILGLLAFISALPGIIVLLQAWQIDDASFGTHEICPPLPNRLDSMPVSNWVELTETPQTQSFPNTQYSFWSTRPSVLSWSMKNTGEEWHEPNELAVDLGKHYNRSLTTTDNTSRTLELGPVFILNCGGQIWLGLDYVSAVIEASGKPKQEENRRTLIMSMSVLAVLTGLYKTIRAIYKKTGGKTRTSQFGWQIFKYVLLTTAGGLLFVIVL